MTSKRTPAPAVPLPESTILPPDARDLLKRAACAQISAGDRVSEIDKAAKKVKETHPQFFNKEE